MQFLTLSRRLTDRFTPEQFAAKIADEVHRARTLYAEGVVRQIWQRGDVPGSCPLIEAPDDHAARSALESLPLVRVDMLEITNVVPLGPCRGFGPDP